MTSLYAGLRAFGNSFTSVIVPTLISIFSKSLQVIGSILQWLIKHGRKLQQFLLFVIVFFFAKTRRRFFQQVTDHFFIIHWNKILIIIFGIYPCKIIIYIFKSIYLS